MATFTAVQRAILRLVSRFDGELGPYGLEAEIALLGLPESEWTPIQDHLEVLENAGLIRPEMREFGASRYSLTDRGRQEAYK